MMDARAEIDLDKLLLDPVHGRNGDGTTSPGAWPVVALLTTAYLLSFIDRQVLALLIEPIKADLAIDDVRFSLLTGLAFSVFFAIAGLPLGWAADTFRRNRVIGAGILCWSLATIGSGLAAGYGQLFVARVLVGVGEAALTPATYSLLADLIAPAVLGRAIAVFSMGAQLGAACAYLLGGVLIKRLAATDFTVPLIDSLHAWQKLFVIVGLPGLVLAPAILLFVRDPRAGRPAASKLSMAQAWRKLGDRRAFLLTHYAGFTAQAAVFFCMMAWLPAVVGRRLGLDAAGVGWVAGLLVLVACPLGTLTAGWLSDRIVAGGRSDGPLRSALIGAAVMIPALLVVAFTPFKPLLLLALGIVLFVAPWPLVLATVSLQKTIEPYLRAQVTALFLLIANLVGQTCSISLVALGTEHLWGDPKMIHRSLALVCIAALLLSILPLRRAMPRYRALLDTRRQER